MKNQFQKIILALVLFAGAQAQLFAQGTAFTYQGRLNDGGSAASGIYDLRFAIYDLGSAGTQQGNLLTNSAVAVSNGLFTVTLDFGNQFSGANRWLEIGVRTNGGGAFTALAPRQQLTPTPYAIFANTASNVSGVVSAAQIGGTIFNSSLPASPNFSGTVAANNFSGNGANVSNVNAAALNGLSSSNFWNASGNSGTSPANGNFLGTTDNQPLLVKVNGQQAMRYEPTTDTPNVIGGYSGNSVAPGLLGATIGGGGTAIGGQPNSIVAGGQYGTIAGGFRNIVMGYGGAILGGAVNTNGGYFGGIGAGEINTEMGNYSWISGGRQNTIQTNSDFSTISGGYLNTIQTNDNYSTISGGGDNTIITGADYGTISGGANNQAGLAATVAGGYGNSASGAGAFVGGGGYDGVFTSANTASGRASVVGGGLGNLATTNYAVVGGGNGNIASGLSAVVGGGTGNTASGLSAVVGGGSLTSNSTNGFTYSPNLASGISAVVPGGAGNHAAGNFSFAAGYGANADHNGTFVWADSQNAAFISTANDQFLIRAQGGVGINTNNPGNAGLCVNGTIVSPMWNVTTMDNITGALPKTNSFTTGGGTLVISASGSGYSTVAGASIGMDIKLDGVLIDSCIIFANPSLTHMAFVPKTFKKNGVASGSHTLTLSARSGTTTDGTDNFCVTVQELPF